MAKKKNQENILFILMGVIILGLIIAGFIIFQKQIVPMFEEQKQIATASETTIVKETEAVPQQEDEFIPQEDVKNIQIYYGIKGKDKLEFETKRVRKSKMLITQARQVVNQLLEVPSNERLYKLIPDGTTLRGLFYDSGVYTIDFSREFSNVFNYGANEQILTLYSVVNSITELDPHAKVKFMVNGTELEGEDGHVDLGAKLTRFEGIIER